MSMQKELDFLSQNSNLFLDYLREKYPVHSNSNIFLRDIQYGIKNFFEKRDIKLKQKEIEQLTNHVITVFESTGLFYNLSHNTWRVNFSTKNNVKIDNPTKVN